MASVGDSCCLWSPDNKDGRTIVSEHANYHDLLMDNFTTLVKSLDLSDSFWNLLKECGVVDENIKTKVQGKKTKQAQVLGLLDHIINSEVYKFHGFAWAIVNTKQYNLAKKLGFQLSVYFNATFFLKSSSFLCPACCEFYTKAYILPECGHYVCSPCVKGAQFLCKENQKEDITCPVPDCGKASQTNEKLGRDIGVEEDKRYAKLCQLVQSKTKELQKKKYSRVEVKDNNNSALEVAVKQTKHHLSTYEQTYRTYLDTISDAEPRLKVYLEEKCNKVINWIKQLHSEKEEFMHQSKFQVQTRYAQSVQWLKILDDLMIISHICPSEVVKTASFTLAGATPDVLDYLEQLVSGTVIPQNILLPQNINVDAATKHPKAAGPISSVLPPSTMMQPSPSPYMAATSMNSNMGVPQPMMHGMWAQPEQDQFLQTMARRPVSSVLPPSMMMQPSPSPYMAATSMNSNMGVPQPVMHGMWAQPEQDQVQQTTAGYTADMLFEWKHPQNMTLVDVDWTTGGHIVTGTSQHFIRLSLDLESQSVIYNHQQHETYLTSVSTSVDDMIYLSCKQNVKIFNSCMMCWENWRQSFGFNPSMGLFAQGSQLNQNIPTRVAGGHKYLVSGSLNGSVNIYDRQRKLLYNLMVPALGNICICENTLVAIGNGIHLINLDTKKQMHVPVGTEGEGRLVSPFDVAPFGEDHFLVYDQALQDFKVFNLTGEFILKLRVDNMIKPVLQGQNPLKNLLMPLERPDRMHIATFPKRGRPTHLAVVCDRTLQIYSLTSR